MVHSSIHTNPTDFIYFAGFAIVMISKNAITLNCGQQIINESEKIINVLYEVPWTERDMKTKKKLIALMTFNQVDMKINVMGFYDLDLENFREV